MKLFIGLRVERLHGICQPEVIQVSDLKKSVDDAIEADKKKYPANAYLWSVLETEALSFSSCFTSRIASDYEMECIEETVRSRLSSLGINTDSPDASEVIGKITADVYHDVMHYDVDEEYALDESLKAHSDELDALKKGDDE